MQAALCAAFAIAVFPAHAQDSREREALRRAQQMLSRMQQQNADLQREKAELEEKLETAEGELKKAQDQVTRLRRTSRALDAAQKDKGALQTKLSETETRLKDTAQRCQEESTTLRGQLRETQAALEAARSEGEQTAAGLTDRLEAQTRRAEVCQDKNARLYSVTIDLIDRYKENRGAWEKFLLSEPFTQLKSVEVENLLEDMRDKAGQARVEDAAKGKKDAGTVR